MPVLPLFAPFVITGVSDGLATFMARRHVQLIASVALSATIVLNISTVALHKYTSRFDIGIEQNTAELWPSIATALDWLKANSEPQDVVAASPDSLVYLYTSLKAVQPFVYQPAALFYGAPTGKTGTFSDFKRHLEAYRPRFLLYYDYSFEPRKDDFAGLIQSAEAKYPGWLSPVYRAADPRVVVYEFDWNRGP
jgi:hypothetical protein